MDVKFITVRQKNINTVPIVDGQIVALEDHNGFYYDMNSSRYKVSALTVSSELSGVGREEEIYVLTQGENPGIYIWDPNSNAYVLIANKDTDTYLTLINSIEEKVYLVGTNGQGTKELLWNTSVYVDLKNGNVVAKEFKGKATETYKADNADNAVNAENADTADVANKIGTSTVGDTFTGVYILNGVPTQVAHSVKKDVPEDAVFTDTTYSDFIGATEEQDGSNGLVPAPIRSDANKFLQGDGTWADVVIPDMEGCTSDADGKAGLVPYPAKGKYNSFLKGDGTWASYSAGYGLELVSLTFNLEDSGVTPGTYGPIPNADNMTTFKGEYILVPRITVDKYGRVTDIKEIPCYAGGGGSAVVDDYTLNTFTFTPDGERLLCTYDDIETAAATFEVDESGHLLATYRYDPSPITLNINSEGHCIANEV